MKRKSRGPPSQDSTGWYHKRSGDLRHSHILSTVGGRLGVAVRRGILGRVGVLRRLEVVDHLGVQLLGGLGLGTVRTAASSTSAATAATTTPARGSGSLGGCGGLWLGLVLTIEMSIHAICRSGGNLHYALTERLRCGNVGSARGINNNLNLEPLDYDTGILG